MTESKTLGHRIGNKRSKTYNSWRAMKERCLCPTHTKYADYGARGIKVCERWLTFSLFVEDMGERPEGMTIDRLDNCGDYELTNCRWANPKQQSNNRRSVKMIERDGKKLNAREWSKALGLTKLIVAQRLRRGWTEEEAVTTPALKGARTRQWFETQKRRLG